MLDEKDRMLLKLLIFHDKWLTSFSLSSLIGISVRSVKSYISGINAAYPGLIASSRRGFFVEDKKRLSEILRSSASGGLRQQGAGDRRKYILQKLLLNTDSYDLDQMADDLAVSPVTLLKELPKLNDELAEYELTLKTKNNRASITGPESGKKKIISRLIYEDTRDSFLSVKLMQGYLPHYDLAEIRKIIFVCLRERHYFMDDFSTMNLVMHIGIAMERRPLYKTESNQNTEDAISKTFVSAHIQSITTDISTKLCEKFDQEFTQREIYDFSLLVMTRVIKDSAHEIQPEALDEAVGERVIRLVKLMQQKAGEMFSITLTNPSFTVRFALHVKNLLARLENNIQLRNPQAAMIKNTYPFIYDVSVYMASIITAETSYVLSEDEISYIALHIGVLIEERKTEKNEVTAIFLNPHYFYKPSNLMERGAQIFENNLHIAGVVSSEDDLENYSGYDMIVSTIPSAGFTGKPFVQISDRLDNRDIAAVCTKAAEILKNRIKIKVEAKLKHIFREELFYISPAFKDQNDAIHVMAGDMAAQGYVDTDFKEKLFQREKVSSSAYSNIAMPHPLEMCAFISAIGVSLHPHGIAWNNSRVNIVFLLAINTRDSLFFKDIFDFITEVISDEQNLKTILETKTYDAFIDTLVSFAK